MADPNHPQKFSFLFSDKTLTLVITFNSLIALGLVGLTYYTKFIYKKPPITEATERERLKQIESSQIPPSKSGMITFDPITVNLLSSYPPSQKMTEVTQTSEQKSHFITLGLALEIRDENQKKTLYTLKPFFLDELIQLLGKRTFEELITIQGRYILNSQIVHHMNRIIEKKTQTPPSGSWITHAYFTQFIVQ